MNVQENGLGLSGFVRAECWRNGKLIWVEEGKNILPDIGLNHIMRVALSLETAAPANYYVGMLDNYTPVAGSTMAEVGANEITNYVAGTRPAYSGVTTNKVTTNTAATAAYTIGVGGAVAYGAFLATSAVKGEVASTLVAAKLFGASRTLLENDVINITYEITGSSV